MRSFLSVSRAVRASLFSAAIVGLAAALMPAAQAQNPVNYTVTLAATSPTFIRPSSLTTLPTGTASGTSVYYQAQQFYVNTTGSYTLQTTNAALVGSAFSPFDTVIALYGPTFNPTNGLTNILGYGDDDSTNTTSTFLSLITANLTSNTQYVLVTTTYTNLATGVINSRITGTPAGSVVTLGTVGGAAAPEPGSLSLLGMGLVSGAGTLGVVRRRRKAA